MQATITEIEICKELSRCRFLPGSFDKRFGRMLRLDNISPLQKWWIYNLGYKYRKQINKPYIEQICSEYISTNEKPLSRKESEKILRAAKSKKLSKITVRGPTGRKQKAKSKSKVYIQLSLFEK